MTASWVFVLTLVGYPLVSAGVEFLGLTSRSATVPFRALVLGLALVAIIKSSRSWGRNPATGFWFVWWTFWGLYIGRMVIDSVLNPEALKIPLSEYLLYGIGMTLLPAVAAATDPHSVTSERTVNRILLLGTVGLLANAWIISNQQIAMGIEDITVYRAETETLNPIAFGHIGVTVALLALWQLLYSKTGTLKYRILMLGALGIAGFCIVIAGSRGPVISLAAALAVLIVYAGRHLINKWSVGAAVAVVALFLFGTAIDTERVMIVARVTETLFSDDIRAALLRDGVQAFLRHPLIGAGTEPLETYPHNLILESFLVFGITTGFLFLTILVYALYSSIRVGFLKTYGFWVVLLLTQYFLLGMVSGALYLSSPLWATIALIVMLRTYVRRERKLDSQIRGQHLAVGRVAE